MNKNLFVLAFWNPSTYAIVEICQSSHTRVETPSSYKNSFKLIDRNQPYLFNAKICMVKWKGMQVSLGCHWQLQRSETGWNCQKLGIKIQKSQSKSPKNQIPTLLQVLGIPNKSKFCPNILAEIPKIGKIPTI